MLGYLGCVDIDDALSVNTVAEFRQLVSDDGNGNRPFANASIDSCISYIIKKNHHLNSFFF